MEKVANSYGKHTYDGKHSALFYLIWVYLLSPLTLMMDQELFQVIEGWIKFCQGCSTYYCI